MDLPLLFKAIFLGVVEGLTEFLPVSSTGHLIIFGDLLHFSDGRGKGFEIVIQLGAVLGVVWDYRVRLSRMVTGIRKTHEQRFILNLIIACLPAAIMGLLLHEYITTHLFNPVTVAWALIVGGILILIIERLPLKAHVNSMENLSPIDAIKIGVAQTFSLFPGVSRAGATIMAIMFTATFYEFFKNINSLNSEDFFVFAVGFIMAFLTALVVVKAFLIYVAGHNFTLFAIYRIGFGLLVLAYFRV